MLTIIFVLSIIKIEVCMKRIKYNDTYIYVDDAPLEDSETGIFIDKKNNEILEKTIEIKPISGETLLENTLTNIWGDSKE